MQWLQPKGYYKFLSILYKLRQALPTRNHQSSDSAMSSPSTEGNNVVEGDKAGMLKPLQSFSTKHSYLGWTIEIKPKECRFKLHKRRFTFNCSDSLELVVLGSRKSYLSYDSALAAAKEHIDKMIATSDMVCS